jgi:Sodium Bile acid symporter family
MRKVVNRFLVVLIAAGCGDSYNVITRWASVRSPVRHGKYYASKSAGATPPIGRGALTVVAPKGVSEVPWIQVRGSKRTKIGLLSHSSTSDSSADGEPQNTGEPIEQPKTTLDRTLSRLTQGFPVYVLLAALSGVYKPSLLTWVNQGSLISVLLASVMCGTGLSLQAEDFRRIPPYLVVFGVACQFLIMPLSSFLVANTWLKADPDLFLGLCLVGCSPGTCFAERPMCRSTI